MQNIQYNQSTSKVIDPNADLLSSLPTNLNQPTHNEIEVINRLFTNSNQNMVKNILLDFQNDFILGIVFVILSLPQVDSVITKFVVITQKSPYILLAVKALLFVLISWLLKNFWLIRK